jgi:hypothetical protein
LDVWDNLTIVRIGHNAHNSAPRQAVVKQVGQDRVIAKPA